MYRVRIFIFLKESVSDPEGLTIKSSLSQLFKNDEVEDVRLGKSIDIFFKDSFPENKLEKTINAMCEKFLVNSVIEDYEFEWKKIDTLSLE